MSHEAQPCQTQGRTCGGTTSHPGPSLQVWPSQPDVEEKPPGMETGIRDRPTHPPPLRGGHRSQQILIICPHAHFRSAALAGVTVGDTTLPGLPPKLGLYRPSGKEAHTGPSSSGLVGPAVKSPRADRSQVRCLTQGPLPSLKCSSAGFLKMGTQDQQCPPKN